MLFKAQVARAAFSSVRRIVCACALIAPFFCPAERTLSSSSPFLPAKIESAQTDHPKPSPRSPANDRFTLKGISKIDRFYLFSIYDKRSKKSRWVEAGANVNGLTILSYDPSTKTVRYALNGKEGQMRLENGGDQPLHVVLPSNNQRTYHETASPTAQHETEIVARNSSKQIAKTDFPFKGPPAKTADVVSNKLNLVHFAQYPRKSTSNPATPRATFTDTGFSSLDIFAMDPETIRGAPRSQIAESPVAVNEKKSTRGYQVKRRNRVHNPDGKKPTHMSFAAWMALRN